MKRIGLLGGSFDPVHLGHIHLAKTAKERLGLDIVEFVPCHIAPHKTGFHISDVHRIGMLQLVIDMQPRFALNAFELEHNGVSYSIHTLKNARSRYGEHAALFFILGWDAWLTLSSWYDWQSLFKWTNFAIFGRHVDSFCENTELELFTEGLWCSESSVLSYAFGRCVKVNADNVDISSTRIREAIGSGKSVTELLPESVSHYIDTNKLYG